MCLSKKGPRRSGTFCGQSPEAETSFKEGPVLLRFTGKHVGHPALFLL